MRFVRLVLVAVVSGIALPSASAAAEPARPSAPKPAGIAAFTRHAQFVDAKISPKGTYLAAISLNGGVRELTFVNLATRQFVWRFKSDGESMVGAFHWTSDERVLIELVDVDPSFTAAPVFLGEMYAVDATGKNGRFVFGYRAGEMQTGSNIRKAERTLGWGTVLDTFRNDEHHVLIATASWREAGDSLIRVHKLDVRTGRQEMVLQGPIPETDFVTDENGEPRIAHGRTAEWKRRFFFREPKGTWQDITTAGGLSERGVPIGFSARDRTMHVLEPVDGGFGLWAIRVGTGERRLLARTTIAPPYPIRSRVDDRIIGIEYEADLPRYEWIEPQHPLARVLDGLVRTYPGEHVHLLNTTDDGKKAVVHLYADRDPGKFLLVDVDKMSAEEVVDVRPWIDPDAMAETSAFHINASDGFRIHGYVTLPPSPGSSPPPLVVLPHGGPHFVRDRWGFDPDVQLLAASGFAVLQVNYRGSGGYGEAYGEAGHRRWGTRIVEDIVDATHFAIRKGFGDARRVCIYGGSFGGYAALQAAIAAPDLFRCAVGFAGVYDLTLLPKSDGIAYSRLGKAYLRKVLGDDDAELRRTSPVYNASKVKARVLLVHGERDRRAPLEHAEAMRKALEKAGNPPEWLLEPREGHGFYDEGARERMYARVLAFLRENTAAPPAAVPAAAR